MSNFRFLIARSTSRWMRLRYSRPLPEAGADGNPVIRFRHEEALGVHLQRQHWQPPGGRAEDRPGVVGDLELGLVARAEQAVRLLLVQAGGAAGVGADLRVRH